MHAPRHDSCRHHFYMPFTEKTGLQIMTEYMNGENGLPQLYSSVTHDGVIKRSRVIFHKAAQT